MKVETKKKLKRWGKAYGIATAIFLLVIIFLNRT